MNCIYCAAKTSVVNSRQQKRDNNIWRRRHCLQCNAVFTSIEAADLSYSVSYKPSPTETDTEPFSRDKIFISIFEACKHRPAALEDATALTSTILRRLNPYFATAAIERKVIVSITLKTLEKFDKAAASHYAAYHC